MNTRLICLNDLDTIKFDIMLKCDADGSRPLYRPRGWNRDEKVKEKRAKKVDWYKRGG